MSKSALPLLIGIGTRIRKSPYYDSNLKYDGSKNYNSVETVFGFRMDNEIWSVLTNGFYFQEISETLLFLRLLTKINYNIERFYFPE